MSDTPHDTPAPRWTLTRTLALAALGTVGWLILGHLVALDLTLVVLGAAGLGVLVGRYGAGESGQ
jgi:hypothetical protein